MNYGNSKVTCKVATQPENVMLTVTHSETLIKQGSDLISLASKDAARELAEDILAALTALESDAQSG